MTNKKTQRKSSARNRSQKSAGGREGVRPQRSPARRLVRWTVWSALGLLLGTSACFALLQTRTGRQVAASWVEKAVKAHTGMGLRIQGLQGLVPLDFSVAALVLQGDDGPWLRVQDLSLQWRPEELLKGRFYLGHVQASNVEVLARPPGGEVPSKPETGAPAWPPSLPSMVVERLSVERLFVDPAVLGQEARFSVRGRMDVAGNEGAVEGDFQVWRVDGPEERAGVSWVLETSPPSLDLDLRVKAPKDGWLPAVAGVRPGDCSLRVTGRGPLDHWQGRIEAQSAAWGGVRSGLQIQAAQDRLSVKAEGGFQVTEALVPKAAAGLVDHGRGGLSFQAALTDQGVVAMDRLALTMDGVRVLVSGRFERQEHRGEARVELVVPGLGRIQGPGLPDAAGRLEARARVQGSLGAPEAELDVEVSGLGAAGVEAGSARAWFAFRPPEKGGFFALEGLQVLGRGVFQEVAVPAADPPLRRDRVQWDLDMHFTSSKSLSVSFLRLEDESLEALFTGRIGLAEQSLDGRLRLDVQDLGRAPLVQGKGSVSASIRASGVSRSLSAEVQGRLEGMGPVPDVLEPLVGAGGDFQGSISLREGRSLEVSGFRVHLPGAGIRVQGEADLVEKTLRASVEADMPNAGVLSGAAGLPLEGHALIRMEVRGPFQDPRGHVEATLREAKVDGFFVEEVRAAFEAARLMPVPAGRLELDMARADLAVSARADVSGDASLIELENLSVQGAGALVSGDLVVHAESGTMAGDLNGSVQDLSSFRDLVGQELSGRAGFSLHLFGEGDVQNAVLDLRVEELLSSSGGARRVDLKAEASNVLREPTADATLRVQGFQHDRIRMEELVLHAAGGPADLSFDLQARGHAGPPFRVTSEGGLRRAEEHRVLEITALEGEVGPHVLKLVRPSKIRFKARGGFETAGLVMEVGGGKVAMEGSLGARMDLETQVQTLPLSLLALAGVPSMEGALSGGVLLSGTPGAPRAEAELTAEGVRPADPSWGNLPRFGVDATASFQDHRLEARITVTGEKDEAPLEAWFTLPAKASLFPLVVDLPRQGEVHGRVKADVDLAPLPVWFALEGHKVSGRLQADLALSGAPASPEVKGGVRVQDGSYELLSSGSVFREVDVLLRVDGRDLVLEHVRAVDGDGGGVRVQGALRIRPDQGFPFEGLVTLEDFHLLRLDDLTVRTGGEIEISGSMRKADLSGSVRVVSAEVRIPDRLPPRIQELDVVEVKDRQETSEPKPSSRKAPAEAPEVTLDLDVEIPGRAFVRGRGLDSEWEGGLSVKGTAARPRITGELSIVRGHYDFFGERFSLTSGTVFFDGSHPPDPLMDITAERRMADMTGRITLSGRPATLRVQVSSDPPLPRDEVMARLLFGRSLASITPIQALKLARAMDALAGGRTFGFVDRVQQAVGVDRVEVIQSDDAQGSTALSVGKYVGEGAYVEVEKGLGSEDGKVSVEYELTPRITVETEVGSDAAGGVEVKWKWDY